MKHDVKAIGDQFQIYGDFVHGEPYGSGHINDTYAATYNQSGTDVRYIFQRINHNIFKNPVALMENVQRVTSHQQKKLAGKKERSRRSLTVIPTKQGDSCLTTPDGNYWRAYLFVEKAKTYDIIETPDQAFQAARAFGEFQKALVDLPGGRLHETIPNFHNTPSRFERFKEVLKQDSQGRAKEAEKEIEFALAHERMTKVLLDLSAKGEIPERVTHNDTKLNNVMIDDDSGEGICVIDLDTVMPGLALYDFGDLVRTSTSPSAEDEKDLSKVDMKMEMFEALVKGYLTSASDFLTKAEKDHLPFSGKLITFEIGLRFLTDFLEGDVYFKIHREGHNLDRCRTQFKLVEIIESKEDDMLAFVNSI